MKFIKFPALALLVVFTALSFKVSAQADINDFLSGQVTGNRIFLEYDHEAMLDSISALLNTTTQLTDSINTLADSIVTLNQEVAEAGFTPITNDNIHTAVDLWESDLEAAHQEYGHIALWNTPLLPTRNYFKVDAFN